MFQNKGTNNMAKPDKSLSKFSISCTNVKGLGIGTIKGDKKINAILALNTDITVLTETRSDHSKILTLKNRLRSQLSGFTFYGTNSNLRGVTVMLKNSSGITFEGFKAIDNNTIKLTALLPDQTKLAAICCYAPSDSDDPTYWESVFEEFSNLEADYKFISGDFNVTLDPEMDTQG